MNNIPKQLETEHVSIARHATCANIRVVHLKTEKAVQTFQESWKKQFPTYSDLQVGEPVTILLNKEVNDQQGLYAPRELASLIEVKQVTSHITQLWQKFQTFIKSSPLFQTFSKRNFQWH